MRISLQIATMADAAEMAPRMRPADAAEVHAQGCTPLSALEDSIRMSRGSAWTVRYDGEIMGIWGLAPLCLLTGEQAAWLLTTDVVDRHPKTFFKISKQVVDALQGQLINWVDARHVKALRWAERLGFAASSVVPVGRDRVPFVRISMRRA